eukprot:3226815-Amphidinium_carterae.1
MRVNALKTTALAFMALKLKAWLELWRTEDLLEILMWWLTQQCQSLAEKACCKVAWPLAEVSWEGALRREEGMPHTQFESDG